MLPVDDLPCRAGHHPIIYPSRNTDLPATVRIVSEYPFATDGCRIGVVKKDGCGVGVAKGNPRKRKPTALSPFEESFPQFHASESGGGLSIVLYFQLVVGVKLDFASAVQQSIALAFLVHI